MSALKKIPLNITAAEGIIQSKKINAVTTFMYFNIQFFFSLAGGEENTKVRFLQTLDGANFDYITDLDGEDVFLELNPDNNTATLNLVAFFTTVIILEFEFPAGVSGSISHALIISR